MSDLAPVKPQTDALSHPPVSFEEWLASAPDSRITEWVEGEVIEMSPVSDKHEAITRWLTAFFHVLLDNKPLGYIRTAPFVLKLPISERGREPDLMFIRAEHAERLHTTYVEGPADAVFEIVSPESVARDRGEKFVEYEKDGVSEYWLIDPERKQVELYRLGTDRCYHAVPPQEGRLHSMVMEGLYLRPEWLWASPTPRILAVLEEMGVL